EQDGRHAGGQAHAHRHDAGLDVLHGVVDGQPGGDHATRAVDVETDVLVRILAVQEQELSHDHIGDLVVDGPANEDDPVLQAAGDPIVSEDSCAAMELR